MKAAPDPVAAVPTETDLTDEMARRVASRISDRLLDIEEAVKVQMNELLPEIIRCGLGVKVTQGGYRPFEFLGTNGFKGLIENVVEAVANVHAEQNADEAFELALSSLRNKDGVWHEKFVELIEGEYVSGYKSQIRNSISSRVKGPAEDATKEVGKAAARISAAVSHAIGDMRLIHENRLKMLVTEMKEVLDGKRAQ